MRSRKFLGLVLSIFLTIGAAPAMADTVTDRAATVEILKQKYVKVLDEQHLTLLALKEKMKVDPYLLKQVNAVIADFNTNYAAIVKGLENPDQAIQPIIDLCAEEVEEFGNSIYQLQQMVKQIKFIICVKGKSTKTIAGLKPVCPKGYIKKK